eukprot:281852-Chlamydomonas_euryale.AAC.1
MKPWGDAAYARHSRRFPSALPSPPSPELRWMSSKARVHPPRVLQGRARAAKHPCTRRVCSREEHAQQSTRAPAACAPGKSTRSRVRASNQRVHPHVRLRGALSVAHAFSAGALSWVHATPRA